MNNKLISGRLFTGNDIRIISNQVSNSTSDNNKSLKILCISDIHFSSKSFDIKNKITCDVFVIAGDLLRNGFQNKNIFSWIANLMESIKADKKIIILGNNDYLPSNNKKSIKDSLLASKEFQKPSLQNINIVDTKEIISYKKDDKTYNFFCSVYNEDHNSMNKYGALDKFLPEDKELDCDIFITHGSFKNGILKQAGTLGEPKNGILKQAGTLGETKNENTNLKNTKLKNKLFIYGHDHIYKGYTPTKNETEYYIIKDHSLNNYYVNVSTSESEGLSDRDVYFTLCTVNYEAKNNKLQIEVKLLIDQPNTTIKEKTSIIYN